MRRVAKRVRARTRATLPPLRFGGRDSLAPVSRAYGFDRGQPIDRYWIEDFLRRHAGHDEYSLGDVRGAVLEIGGSEYARKFGTQVESIDVLHADSSNPEATIVGDLTTVDCLPADRFDCIICTQTLQVVFDVPAAIASLDRALRDGGTALVTMAGISARCKPDADRWGDFWRFTSQSARRLFEQHFAPSAVHVEAYGNVRSAVAFLHGLAAEELSRAELELRDPDYEALIAVRVVKRR